MSSDNHLASWRLSADSCTASFLERYQSQLWLLGNSWSLEKLAVSFVREGQEDKMWVCCVSEYIHACLGLEETCSHSQMPLTLDA